MPDLRPTNGQNLFVHDQGISTLWVKSEDNSYSPLLPITLQAKPAGDLWALINHQWMSYGLIMSHSLSLTWWECPMIAACSTFYIDDHRCCKCYFILHGIHCLWHFFFACSCSGHITYSNHLQHTASGDCSLWRSKRQGPGGVWKWWQHPEVDWLIVVYHD